MYNFKEIEKKQRDKWVLNNLFKTDSFSKKPRYYVLEMLPYPSGALHMGHVRNYSIGDALARYKRMKGFEVMHPIGWDSFGLPAEEAAIKRGVKPNDWTKKNISQMKEQLKYMGFSYDWEREVTTSDAEYYRWNQWLFSRMFEKGLAYKNEAFVNWSESMQTVLANEQVESAFCMGKSDDIIQKKLNQWFFKITDYAEELISGLYQVDWPENVKMMQKNWIGKSVGVEVEFDVPGFESIAVFTTRLDTIYGATYIAISMGHEFINKISNEKIEQFIKSRPLSKEKFGNKSRGIFTGHYAVNPVNGSRIPIWISDYVLDYGTKAVMGVPAHDERDYEFATMHKLDIKSVIQSDTLPFCNKGVLVSSDEFSGLESDVAIEKIVSKISKIGYAEVKVNYKLKDWLISRQRYWGTPIPIRYVDGKEVLSEIPVILPEDIKFGSSGNPIKTSQTFGTDRESDTMDTFMDSSWYYFRYLDNKNSSAMFDKEISKLWPQVDMYIGGVEHAVMHLLYARFIHKVLRDLGLVTSDEPFKKLLTQGMVLSNSYYNTRDNRYYFEKDIKNLDKTDFVVTLEKMSKSKNNGVAPEEIADIYGVDAVRLFILFAAPPAKDLEWSEHGIAGASRFLNRVYLLVTEPVALTTISAKDSKEFLLKLNETIAKVTNVMEDSLHFNVAVAALMEFVNSCYEYRAKVEKETFKSGILKLLKMLSIFAPHLCDELFQFLGGKGYLINESWPEVDQTLTRDEIVIPIQINGKLRSSITIDVSMTDEQILEIAKERVSKYLVNIKKEIYIKGKIINFLVG